MREAGWASRITDSHIPWCPPLWLWAARPSGGMPLLPLLAAQAELLDQGLVAIGAHAPQIIEQPAALAHQLEQAAAGMVVLLVRLEVERELVDPLRQQRDLHLGGAGVGAVGAVGLEDLAFLLSGDQGMADLPR